MTAAFRFEGELVVTCFVRRDGMLVMIVSQAFVDNEQVNLFRVCGYELFESDRLSFRVSQSNDRRAVLAGGGRRSG